MYNKRNMQEWYERSIQLITAEVCYTYENTDKKSTFFPQATWAEKYNNKFSLPPITFTNRKILFPSSCH